MFVIVKVRTFTPVKTYSQYTINCLPLGTTPQPWLSLRPAHICPHFSSNISAENPEFHGLFWWRELARCFDLQVDGATRITSECSRLSAEICQCQQLPRLEITDAVDQSSDLGRIERVRVVTGLLVRYRYRTVLTISSIYIYSMLHEPLQVQLALISPDTDTNTHLYSQPQPHSTSDTCSTNVGRCQAVQPVKRQTSTCIFPSNVGVWLTF